MAQDRDVVSVGGVQKHVYSYLADFLFTPERARSPVKALSGGEKARLLLARLFLRPSNLLVMDEPPVARSGRRVDADGGGPLRGPAVREFETQLAQCLHTPLVPRIVRS